MDDGRESLTDGYKGVIDSDESLRIFIKKMGEFDKAFCDFMAEGADFTLKLEIRGIRGEILHTSLYRHDTEKPVGVDQRLNKKKSKNDQENRKVVLQQ